MRDLRDPQQLGNLLLYRDKKRKWRTASASVFMDAHADVQVDDYSSNPSCIDKYGYPNDVEPRWQEIKVA